MLFFFFLFSNSPISSTGASPGSIASNSTTNTFKATDPEHEKQAHKIFEDVMREIKYKSQSVVREASWCRFQLQNMLLFCAVTIVFVLCMYDRHVYDEKRYDSFLITRGSCNLKQDDTFLVLPVNSQLSSQCFENIVSPGEMHNPWMLFVFMGIAAAFKNG